MGFATLQRNRAKAAAERAAAPVPVKTREQILAEENAGLHAELERALERNRQLEHERSEGNAKLQGELERALERNRQLERELEAATAPAAPVQPKAAEPEKRGGRR